MRLTGAVADARSLFSSLAGRTASAEARTSGRCCACRAGGLFADLAVAGAATIISTEMLIRQARIGFSASCRRLNQTSFPTAFAKWLKALEESLEEQLQQQKSCVFPMI
jgi:hypothetical protein